MRIATSKFRLALGYSFSIILMMTMAACNLKITPEKGCNFVMNSMQQRVSWNSNLPISIYIHDSVPSDYIPAVTNAMKTWETALGRKLFEVVGVVSGPATPQKDGVSIIYFMSKWEESKTSEQARTTIYWQGEQIVEGDIRINAKNFTFSTGSSPVAASVDFESLLIHELGHLLGLAHDNEAGSVMNERLASGVLRRDIGNVDLASVKCEY
ncbi:MAG: hypothetical protein A4S09_12385 [Proteobacteria bacterium SG_bin7]|nr:MAG: hypothetical protein A4S09_12385 [Proteobacteria bacterium SG_bin7]